MTLDADDRMSPAPSGTTTSGTTTCGERLDVPSGEHPLTPATLLASRTALTSIIGYAELLIAEDEGGWPQRLRMLRAIEQNGHRLYALLNHSSTDPPERLDGLENLERLESLDLLDGPRDGHGVAVDISELLHQVRLHVVRLLSDLEPYVTIVVPPGLRMHHQAATGLRLVTRHLVENAVKYSGPRSPVEVEAGRAGTLLSLRVSDSGVGIPPDEHTKVFERFYRSAYALEQRIPGHGVGLTTVRNIVLRQGGAIDLRSTPSAGTTVTVTLPLGPLVTTSALADPDA